MPLSSFEKYYSPSNDKTVFDLLAENARKEEQEVKYTHGVTSDEAEAIMGLVELGSGTRLDPVWKTPGFQPFGYRAPSSRAPTAQSTAPGFPDLSSPVSRASGSVAPLTPASGYQHSETSASSSLTPNSPAPGSPVACSLLPSSTVASPVLGSRALGSDAPPTPASSSTTSQSTVQRAPPGTSATRTILSATQKKLRTVRNQLEIGMVSGNDAVPAKRPRKDINYPKK